MKFDTWLVGMGSLKLANQVSGARARDPRIQDTVAIKTAVGVELDQHPKQHSRAITITNAIVVLPIVHHRDQLMLGVCNEFIIPFLHQ